MGFKRKRKKAKGDFRRMRKFKRMIALVTVALFVLSFAAPAFAADDTSAANVVVGKDVIGTKYENDTKKLIALGILTGYEDGTIKPDNKITRAEFAAIVTRELDLVSVGMGTTPFKDVPATFWGSGVINLAYGKGIIKGYPDGTFKPDANVTYAEAITMLVRMLGYEPALKNGSWPATPLAVGSSSGVSKGVNAVANEAASRGDVIKMAANALEADIMEQVSWGDDNNYNQNDEKNILSDVWDITVFDGDDEVAVVDNTPMVDLSGLEADEIELTGGEANAGITYELSTVFNPNDYLGQEVEFWVDEDDDYIYYIAPSGNEDVIFDKIDSFASDNIELDDSGDDYDLIVEDTDVDGTRIWVNISDEVEYDGSNIDLSDYTGANVKVVLNDDEDVAALVVTDYYPTAAAGVIADSNILEAVNDETLEYYDDTDLDLEDTDYVIVRDGLPADLDDLEEGDVINVLQDPDKDDEYYVVATSAKVEGEVTDVRYTNASDFSGFDIYVDGEKYDVAGKNGVDVVTFSDDENDGIESVNEEDDLLDMIDDNVTLYIDALGKVRHIVTDDGSSGPKDVAILSESATIGGFGDEVRFKVVNTSGTEVTYTVDPDDVDLNGAEETVGTWQDYLDILAVTDNFIVLELELDSDGDLKNVDILRAAYTNPLMADYDNGDYDYHGSSAVNEDDETVTLGTGDFRVTDSTIIFDMTDDASVDGDYADVDVVGWSSIKNKNALDVYASTDDDEIEYLFVLNAGGGNLTSEGEYGIFKQFTKSGGDDAIIIIDMNGDEQTIVAESYNIREYIYGDPGSLSKGMFIRYELDGDEMDIVDILGFHDSVIDEVTFAVNGNGNVNEILSANIDIDNFRLVKVSKKSSTYILGEMIDTEAEDFIAGETYFTINSNTQLVDVHDTDKLKASGASIGADDLVLLIDTDDDGSTADFVIKIAEDYPDTFDWLR